MKIKLAWIQSGEIVKQYTLDYEGEDVIITRVRDILRQAKNRFKIQGRQYIMVAGDKTFYISRVVIKDEKNKKRTKDWNVYQVGVDLSEQVTER